MLKVHCSGCGRTEPADKLTGKITRVTLEVGGVMKTREWEDGEKYSEDICEDCVRRIVATYFGVKPIGVIDPPIVFSGAA